MTPISFSTRAFSNARQRALERHEKLTPRAKRLKAQGRLGRKDGKFVDLGEQESPLSGVSGGTPRELLQNVIRSAREGESVSSGHFSREGTNPLSGVTPSGNGSLFSQLGDSIDELRGTIEEGQEAQEEEQRRAEGSTLSQRTARLRGLLRGFRFGT